MALITALICGPASAVQPFSAFANGSLAYWHEGVWVLSGQPPVEQLSLCIGDTARDAHPQLPRNNPENALHLSWKLNDFGV